MGRSPRLHVPRCRTGCAAVDRAGTGRPARPRRTSPPSPSSAAKGLDRPPDDQRSSRCAVEIRSLRSG
ncbi:MAG: hypothetical protein AVDCRST_MAG64-490 [uncultured Phycisphaerae bacterium]|uniref:Uncharacterized protein n=1 Tax=uncultured Phycisphaerae bacterium TaxID=904963 RepID=A0A6J4N962_9BACT|nr:MAG: hypothetical protein AVDCRST_MAG64-490 [uncultured Phycisphaerae bacterium]